MAVKAAEKGKVELKEEFIQLRAKGLSLRKCASRLGVSPTTCWTWAKELDAGITQARAEALEALQEQYYLLKEGRIRLLGRLLQRLQRELQGRDFAEVSDDKLLELLLKVWDELKVEYIAAGPVAGPAHKTDTKLDGQEALRQLEGLLARVQAGQVDNRQAAAEVRVLAEALKAYSLTELEGRLAALETALELRPARDNHRRY